MTPTENRALARKAFDTYQANADASSDAADIIAAEIEAVVRREYGLPEGDVPIGLTDAIAVAFIAGRSQIDAQALAALKSAEIAVEQLCHGQDPTNQCWVTLQEIRDAIA